MGSWNETCMVSQLPICYNSRNVKSFILIQHGYNTSVNGSGTCYNTDYFSPWFFPISGEYNTYGSIEDVTPDWHTNYVLKFFQDELKSGKVVILPNDECEVNSPDITEFGKIEDVFDCIERGALKYRNKKVGYGMVINEIYADLIKAQKSKMKKEHKRFPKYSVYSRLEKTIELLTSFKKSDKYNEYELYSEFVLHNGIECGQQFQHYIEMTKSLNDDDFKDFTNRLRDSINFIESMTDLRKMWIPQTGKGSQDCELDMYSALVKSMSKKIEKMKHED